MSIPHTSYFYWGSKTRISYLRYLSLALFRYHHPKWPMYLYQSDWEAIGLGWFFGEFQQNLPKKHDYIEEAKSVLGVEVMTYKPKDERVYKMPPANISDVFSYEILHEKGGWYFDLDSYQVKELDWISDQDFAFIGLAGLKPWVGVFGARPGSWVMASFMEPCTRSFDKNEYNSTGTYGISSVMADFQWQQRFKQDDVGGRNWKAPEEMFYPLFVTETYKIWERTDWNPSYSQTWAVHAYGGNEDYQLHNLEFDPDWVRNTAHRDWISRYVRSLKSGLFLL